MVSVLEHFDNPYPIIDKCIKKVNKLLIIDCPYNEKELEGEHRFTFDEKTLIKYKQKYFIKRNRIIYLLINSDVK